MNTIIRLSKQMEDAMKTLDPIYPITALQKKTAEVKEAAHRNVVRITENGVGAFVFASEEVYEKSIKEAVDRAVEEALLANVIAHGRADMAAGRFMVGESAWDEIENRAASHA